jgi:glycosyltransferase involved in cell wall biosynthesis
MLHYTGFELGSIVRNIHQSLTPESEAPFLLSICVPTYHRPKLLARTLNSLGPLPAGVEVLVSDNSTANDESEQVTRHYMASQPTKQWRYYRNGPGGSLIGNWNACVTRARGHYVLMLHDDDYLLPGALTTLVQTLQYARNRHEAVLFGVEVVDEHERLMRRQTTSRSRLLNQQDATEKLLTNSSFVRMPGMVVSRRAYLEAGMLDAVQEGTGDVDIWTRVCSRYGLYCSSMITAAYTVHNGAATASMFQPKTIDQLLRVFNRAQQQALLPPDRLAAAKSHFFHQFVLAGAYRSLRNGKLHDARQVLELLRLPSLRSLSTPLRWLPVLACFYAVTRFVRKNS